MLIGRCCLCPQSCTWNWEARTSHWGSGEWNFYYPGYEINAGAPWYPHLATIPQYLNHPTIPFRRFDLRVNEGTAQQPISNGETIELGTFEFQRYNGAFNLPLNGVILPGSHVSSTITQAEMNIPLWGGPALIGDGSNYIVGFGDYLTITTAHVEVDGVDQFGEIAMNHVHELTFDTVAFARFTVPFPYPITLQTGERMLIRLGNQVTRPIDSEATIGYIVAVMGLLASVTYPSMSYAAKTTVWAKSDSIEVDFGATGFSPDGSQVYQFGSSNTGYVPSVCGFTESASLLWSIDFGGEPIELRVKTADTISTYVIYLPEPSSGVAPPTPRVQSTGWGPWNGQGTKIFYAFNTIPHPTAGAWPDSITVRIV
jgi:hypothetical protein